MGETQTPQAAEAPPPQEAAAPPVQQAPPTQRSTGGNGRPREAGQPASLSTASAQDLFRKAYQRDGGETPVAPVTPARAVPEDNAADPIGESAERVDEKAPESGQSAQTPEPSPRPPAQARRAPKRTSTMAPPREDASPEASRSPEAPPSPAAPVAPVAPEPEAPTPQPQDDFRSERWQRAFQAQPGLRRDVARIRNEPGLSEAARAERLAEKLSDGLQAADRFDWEADQLRTLRRENPTAYAQYAENQEVLRAQDQQLAVRISHMIAEAYGVDPDDPGFLEAGPRDGETHEQGLQRFVDFTAEKSPVFSQRLTDAVTKREQALVAKHEAEVTALKAAHQQALQAAEERARARARSPQGSGGTGNVPRAGGNGVVPVGAENGAGRPPATRMPTGIGDVRDLINRGYQEREAAR